MSHKTRHDLEQRAIAAYLGLAIGDALGATVEFMTPREIQHHYGVHQTMIGGGWLRLQAGQVTDDTTMSLALGRALLANKGKIDAFSIAQAFDAWMRAKPVDIGNTVRRNLLHFRRTGDPVAPASEHDAGNGAAMRILPIVLACFGQDQSVLETALQRQAHVTHHNSRSDAACLALALLLHDGLQQIPLAHALARRLTPLVQAFPEFKYDDKQSQNPSGYIVDTLQAVCQALRDSDSFAGCLINVVNRGGDADTTGAIAGMLAGAFYGLPAIPKPWRTTLAPDIAAACTAQAVELLGVGRLS